ncbi:YceG family protein [Clostridium botulinum]|uniref:Putative component of 'biosynthetic module' domain-containing protein n=1 Tax=Clostridium botulinum TaxID=1491 RepID=A0A9Q1ZCH4_CLOBO|nr:YceG family protein [Clostridium botulinum]KEI02340.1 hypothetical protein Z953_07750 [Clostridium botulinum D str. 16868]KEI03951.1 hypothetical protein Y848_03990 [Clostridium botulinum C/D str. Sp77]KLU76837.1 hypothetical protein CBC3_01615 [Clostridium botulinum V891]KOA73543.1 hypothetical protein ADU78_12110 [Clostridium botulinum]KOA79749.1 hypothetical protein ADU77_03310 [Clostridium botulinum]
MSNKENFKENYVKKRTETQAFKASEELNEVLHDKESGCYRSWQFANYKVNKDTLKTTYDEIVLWGPQEAMIRPGWKIEENEVTIPNLFSKVMGVHENIKEYKNEINQLIQETNTLFYKRFPINKKRIPKDMNRVYKSVLNIRGKIDKERLMTSNYWKYEKLNPMLQNIIADKIIEFCNISSFWKHKNFKIKLRMSLINRIITFISSLIYDNTRDERIMKISIFAVLTNLSDELLGILKNFDYPMKVPKIIIYNNNNKKNLTFEDSIILMFMNCMGVDIIIYNPTGTSDIENYIKEENYDIHRLEYTRDSLPFRRFF